MELLKSLQPLLTLADTATEADVITAITKQNGDLVQLRADKKKVDDELEALKTANGQAKIVTLVDQAANDKKITDAEKPDYLKLANADFDTTKKLLDGMKPYESLETKLAGDADVNKAELDVLIKLSGDEIFNLGKFPRLKQLSPAHYKLKYKEAFDKEPEEDKK